MGATQTWGTEFPNSVCDSYTHRLKDFAIDLLPTSPSPLLTSTNITTSIMAGNFDSWEDAAAQDEDLSRQTQNMNMNANSFRPGAGAFQPGAASFQPGATTFQPGQPYQQNGYQNYGYGQQQGYNQYAQYSQGFNQYQQPQQPQQQQQGYNQGYSGQFAAYNQSPGAFQPRQGAPISIAKRSDPQPAAAQTP